AVTANSGAENHRLGGLRVDFYTRRKKERNTRNSQGVTHPSTALAQARLTSEGCVVGFITRGKKECNTRASSGVTHPSTALAQARL
ncbi:unnamed protein product, partial [Musa textilis]